ncbi:hypothetical protein LZ496_11695 [Sphingomonas sp. NSE70-1]|uniref:Uncharacterized protein n=1 Tax=Sphingomonas caseinilyticus TaxID=2908205 RepID=A0ABT0RWT4_9SPHN|nr:hypothetical protein [Sphingomonas caseinilyticus]MCL6699442.1 hypothetical protein [Sphingomonas caseinilyticus]
MALKLSAMALSLIVAAASPLSASQPQGEPSASAPAAGPDALYCLRVDPFTGTHIERIKCWTREQWTDQGVDVDLVWAKDGVEVKG